MLEKTHPASEEPLRWLTVPPISTRSYPDNVGVNCTRNTVLHLCVQLWESVFYNNTIIHSFKNKRVGK